MALVAATFAAAQDRAWVQIEAQPTLAEAEERARAYSGAFPDVAGFALPSGWYAIVLGPYTTTDAPTKLAELMRERLVPGDSFIADGSNFRAQYWPVGADALARPTQPVLADPAPAEGLSTSLQSVIPVDPEPLVSATESPAEARATEAALLPEERVELQAALQWFGFYDALLDGAFGPGTRASMAAWQSANAAEATGILTTVQRQSLLSSYRDAQAEIGLERVTEVEAGIEIDLPLALVQFDRYEPPFVHFAERNDSGVRVLLISEPGDQATLFGLYDLMQSLEIIPLSGERSRGDQSFEISGRDATIESYTHAELSGGLIKGFTLVWPVSKAEKMARVLEAMKSSFKPTGDRALDPGLAPMDAAQKSGMLSGLDVRRPERSGSGFYIGADGHVLTTVELVQACGRVTIDGEQNMTVALADTTTGAALLAPEKPLAPSVFARFQTAPDRAGSDVAVAGYSFGDQLSAPAMTFGTLEALEGLDGESGKRRLSIPTLEGDAGGPVLDASGAVIGMLLPRETGGARVLPEDVNFAVAAPLLATLLQSQGLEPDVSASKGALPPEDLARQARGMTVLVSCWN